MRYMRGMENEYVKMYLARFDEILNQMEEKMLSAKITNSITIDFITCMIPHHHAAIYMCENLLKYTTYQPLIKIANDIIQTQTKGIEQMELIAKTTSGFLNSRRDVNTYYTKYLSIVKTMIQGMREAPKLNNINLNFVNEMIPHHEGAVRMCRNLLQYYIDPRLRMVAENIIKEQSHGIEELKNIRNMLCKSY